MAPSEDIPEYSFDHRTTEYDPNNAYWLSFFADSVYLERDENEAIMRELGLETFDWHSSSGTEAFVASNSDAIIIAFRGTEPTDFNDIAADLKAAQIDWLGGKVHTGFLGAIDEVDKLVISSVTEQQNNEQTVWITGHSLGGALAVLCAAHLKENDIEVSGVYTFGQPRLGNEVFCNFYNKLLGICTFRFANVDDIVPDLPPKSLKFGDSELDYHDVGTPIWVTGDSELVKKYLPADSAINKALSAAKAPGAHSSLGYRDALLAKLNFNPFTAAVQQIQETQIASVDDLDDETRELLSSAGIDIVELAEATQNAKEAVTDAFEKASDWTKDLFKR